MNDFFANLFELWGSNISEISDALFSNNLYTTIGLVLVLTGFAAFGSYYYLFDSPRKSSAKHWFMVCLFTSIAVAIFAFIYSMARFNYLALNFRFGDYINFIITVFLYSMLFIFILSLLGKHWSTHRKDTPIRTRR